MSQQKLNEAVEAAYQALNAAIEIADETGLSFDFEITYGAGATYYPPSVVERDSWLQEYHDLDVNTGGWLASSQSC